MLISERIFHLLKQKGMSQSEFGRLTGIANSTISDWKRKKTNPTSEYIMPICEALEVTPEQLLTGKGIDSEYKEISKTEDIITKADRKLLKEIHTLEEEQQKRLMAYLKALKKLEELEDITL